MDYRDERDALRARVESLEGEIATARAENERMRATESALAAAQRENEKLRAEVRRLQPRGNRPSAWPIAGLVVCGVAVCAGGAALTLLTRSMHQPPVVVEQPGGDERPAATAVEGPAPKPEREPSPRATTVQWEARVRKSDGLAFPVGTACTVRATLRTDGAKGRSPDVEIACGGKSLYRSTDQLEGQSSMSYAEGEVPGPEAGSYRATLQYQDQGPRTGARTQASLSTTDRVAIVWKDTAPSYRVELEVDELSSAWKGPALIEEDEAQSPALRAVVERRGTVESVRNYALVAQGAACSVRVFPAFGKENCRVAVRCGDTLVYGAEGGGFNECTVESGRVFAAKDAKGTAEDRDPQLDMSLPQGSVEVSDGGTSPWSVKIRLAPEGR
jgi:hypothetical protein